MIQPSNKELIDGELYVPGLAAEYVSKKYGVPLSDIAKLASAENPHGASPLAVEAVEDARSRLYIYPDWTARALRTAIAEKYDFDPDCVVCGSGETEVISMVIRAFAAPDEAVLMHKPCFPLYRIYSNCEGRRPIYAPMGSDFEFEMDQYIELLKQRPKIAFLTSPHNPSGRLVDEATVRRVCEAADEATLVVLDEAYIHYSETEGGMHLLREYPNLIVLRTMSKAFGLAGLRVGFAISNNRKLIEPLLRIKPTWNIGQMQVAGGVAGINDDAHVARAVKTVVENRSYVESEMAKLDRFRIVPGSRSNFFLTEILDPSLGATRVFNELLQRGVIVKDGNDIIGLGDRYLRVDVNLKKHMDRFLWALSEIPQD
ncbi:MULTISPECIES: histidinol-phosphate transaminase [unclassified Marinobacter]|uniref:histidinol-phosphate transaminase n=1 Tax=unclassified Marinobacter TaxID=83889 RepID=UPI00200DFDC5|nr:MULTISPECIES: histidinol-phosphate transaminase [unclassified Marinobacter]MCL1483738.1 histidinol-phosphate transaminase [Marinobacter sp.]UQG55335.1 histidinol-phosphate transaminase [Marinobacter sp. M4C]UQG64138.1 histidinol-phosphate transaminase [Marinobacter sp. M2C]UQG68422.1 histidinol-phosphate transaminase [Marinobacter sp. M1C]